MSTKESILNKIADYLALRDHSVKEIKEKLAQKKIYEPEKIEEAIQKAIDQKWFIPEHELSEKVASSLALKKKSYSFILNYLKEKGLPPVDFAEDVEVKAIQGCLIKKFKNPQNLDYEDKQKAMRLLSSRGFDQETCYKVIGQNCDTETEI